MHISPIYSTNLNKPQNKNISMRGLDPTTIIISKIINMGSDAVRDIQRSTKKASLLKRLWTDSKSLTLNTVVRSVQAITKLPDNFYAEPGYFDTPIPILSILRQRFIETVSQIPDSNAILIHTKKDFINSLFNNGHEITKDFRDFFRKLDDRYYGSFKQEIMDKCFFSPQFNDTRKCINANYHSGLIESEIDNFHVIFPDCDNTDIGDLVFSHLRMSETQMQKGAQAYCNLKLLETLDRDLYKSYFNTRALIIDKNKEYLKHPYYFWHNQHEAPIVEERHKKIILPLLNL